MVQFDFICGLARVLFLNSLIPCGKQRVVKFRLRLGQLSYYCKRVSHMFDLQTVIFQQKGGCGGIRLADRAQKRGCGKW